MELSSTDSQYTSFLNEAEVPRSGRFAFGKLLKARRRTALAVLAVSIFCFFTVTIGFFWLHSSSSTDEWTRYSRSLKHGGDIDENVPIWQWREEDFEERFRRFVVKHEKVYADGEERNKRYAIFKDNLHYIHAQNSIEGRTYTLGITKFADLTREEFKTKYLGCTLGKPKRLNFTKVHTSSPNDNEQDVPKAFDWRKKNCVTRVEDQLDCGSCWAFSAVGAISGSYCAKTGSLEYLSEQQLVDCSHSYGNDGCMGGMMDVAFMYVKDHGLSTLYKYPYLARDFVCNKFATPKVFLEDYVLVDENVAAMKSAVATKSTVSVGITVGGQGVANIQHYIKGIFQGECGSDEGGHALLVVGYDRTPEGEEYWILKNSWGLHWGEDGYIRMTTAVDSSNPEGICAILSMPSYPEAKVSSD